MFKSLNKGAIQTWFPTIVGIIIVLLIGGGILAWQYYKAPKEEVKAPEEEVKEGVEDETADWKIYRNEEYGFEVKYPETSDWAIGKETDVPLVIQFGPEWCITIFEYARNPRNLDVEKFCQEKYKNITFEEAPFGDDPCWYVFQKKFDLLDIGGKVSLQVKRVGGPLATTQTLISGNNFILSIAKTESDYPAYEGRCGLLNTDRIYGQMLLTFRFLK